MREPWWTWHWDREEVRDVAIDYKQIVRWRRGSLLTVYKFIDADGAVLWCFFGPFHLCVCFGRSP